MCIADFFHNLSFPATYGNKKNISLILSIWNRKYRSRSRSTIFAMTPLDGKSQNLQFQLQICLKRQPINRRVRRVIEHADAIFLQTLRDVNITATPKLHSMMHTRHWLSPRVLRQEHVVHSASWGNLSGTIIRNPLQWKSHFEKCPYK